ADVDRVHGRRLRALQQRCRGSARRLELHGSGREPERESRRRVRCGSLERHHARADRELRAAAAASTCRTESPRIHMMRLSRFLTVLAVSTGFGLVLTVPSSADISVDVSPAKYELSTQPGKQETFPI